MYKQDLALNNLQDLIYHKTQRDQAFLLVCRVFDNGQGDLGSISSHIILKTFKMVLDTS